MFTFISVQLALPHFETFGLPVQFRKGGGAFADE